jgi:hypothetical protein
MSHFAFFASDVHTQDFWVGEGYPSGTKNLFKIIPKLLHLFFKEIVILIRFFPIIGKLKENGAENF